MANILVTTETCEHCGTGLALVDGVWVSKFDGSVTFDGVAHTPERDHEFSY